jgi:uncharacterized protein YjiS (DUF1127 family)
VLQILQPGNARLGLPLRPATPRYQINLNTNSKQDQNIMLSTLFAAISRRRSRARAIALLQGLDDSRLCDIGISRDQIEIFVDGQI